MTAIQDDQTTIAAPPPTVTVTRAMLWNWWIVALSVVVFVAIGAAAALLRSPTYTAKSRLTVGRINISAPGALSGFELATQALATGYSRSVTALPVAKAVSAKTGISVKDIQSHVTATPIPESPVFRVEATAPNQRQAIALANASSLALIRYAARLNQSNPDSNRLFAAYRGALATRAKARQDLAAAEAHAASPDEAEVESARSAVQAASLRVNALGTAYTASVQSQTSTQLIQVISPAIQATSDKRSTFMIYVFIGLVVGLLVGAAAAFFREARHRPAAAG